jgi:putative sterol carrier protein
MRIRTPRWRAVGQLRPAQWLAPRALGELVRHLGDRDLEKRFGGAVVERMLFGAMTRFFDPDAADGFRGEIGFELTRPVSGGASSWWTVTVSDAGAEARPGRAEDAALLARVPMADFLRVAGGVLDPVEPVLAGRATLSGELGLAARLAEMFGAPPVR